MGRTRRQKMPATKSIALGATLRTSKSAFARKLASTVITQWLSKVCNFAAEGVNVDAYWQCNQADAIEARPHVLKEGSEPICRTPSSWLHNSALLSVEAR